MKYRLTYELWSNMTFGSQHLGDKVHDNIPRETVDLVLKNLKNNEEYGQLARNIRIKEQHNKLGE